MGHTVMSEASDTCCDVRGEWACCNEGGEWVVMG